MFNGQVSNLKAHPELLDQTIELIENSFGYSKKESYKIDFFPLMNESNSHQNFIFKENGEVLGHVGVMLRKLANRELTLNVALIGGVAVLKKHRGKGILTKLLTEVFNRFDQQVGLYILWSDAVELYKRFDFYLAGNLVESNGKIGSKFNDRYIKTKFKNVHPDDFTQIKSIYNEFSLKKYFSCLRTDEDWEKLKNIESTDLYILKESQGRVLGYFCQNKGMDLRGIVHEFGFLEEYQNEIYELFNSLKTWYPSVASDQFPGKNIYQGLFRMGNIKIFNKFLSDRSQGRLLLEQWGKTDVEIKFINKTLIIPKESFFPLIFGPFPPKELEAISCQFFISGLDSV